LLRIIASTSTIIDEDILADYPAKSIQRLLEALLVPVDMLPGLSDKHCSAVRPSHGRFRRAHSSFSACGGSGF
jgi:hypothetical protein